MARRRRRRDDAAAIRRPSPPSLSVTARASTAAVQGGSSTTVVQSALFGKLFRKIVQAAVGHRRRRGRRRCVAGLKGSLGSFSGTTDINITIDPRYTDSNFGTGTPMQQPFGAGFRQASSLQGMELRASKSVFLSLDKLDATNTGRVDVLNVGGNARICFQAENGAAKIVSPFLPVEFCPGRSISTSTPVTLSITMPTLNVMAQFTDAQHYMTKGRQVHAPQSRGHRRDGGGHDRTHPGVVRELQQKSRIHPLSRVLVEERSGDVRKAPLRGGGGPREPVAERPIHTGARYVAVGINSELPALGTAAVQVSSLANQLAGTALAAQAAATKLAVDDALAKSKTAQVATTALAQDAEDLLKATDSAARRVSGNNPNVGAATALVQQTLDEMKAQTAVANAAIQAALQAAQAAQQQVMALESAIVAAGLNQLAATAAAARVGLNFVNGKLSVVTNFVTNLAADVVTGVAMGAAIFIASGIALTIGNIFELFAGGDIIMPASGSVKNLIDRGIATHEYGHYVLCNLLDSAAPNKFEMAYDDAAVQGILTAQSVTAAGAILNESFADMFVSQVAGGTNYAAPLVSLQTPNQLFSYCAASGTNCIEANVDNTFAATGTQIFGDLVLRDVSLFTDAFDGVPLGTPGNLLDVPTNGNQWSRITTFIELASAPGLSAGDEIVSMGNEQSSTSWLRQWISHAMDRGGLLREDNMFAGLDDAMIDHGDSWCARCEVFRLHTLDTSMPAQPPICPAQWVGPRPLNPGTSTTVTCTFEGCPSGQIADLPSRTCVLCPPNQVWDPNQRKCVLLDPG